MKSEETIIRRAAGISRKIFIISLAIVAAVSGVTGYYLAPRSGSVTLTGAGATFPYPLLSAMSTDYSKSNPAVLINYQSIGSGAGIKFLTNKTVDFAASDAPLTVTQIQQAPNSLHIPETIGSVVFAYNLPGIPKGLNLTGPITAGIFLGSITKWNNATIQNINHGFNLPDQAISVVHRSDGSGTTFVWTSYLSLVSPAWNNAVPGGKGTSVPWPVGVGQSGNGGVAGYVNTTQNTAGYVELTYALQNGMTYANIQNKALNYVEPSLSSTAAALNTVSSLPSGDQSWGSVTLLDSSDPNAYPIASFSYLLVYKELNVVRGMTLAKAQALVNFLWFVVHGGQFMAPGLHYVRLPDSAIAIDESTIKSITFNGQTLRS